MTTGMKIILKLTIEVKEIEEHVSYEGKRQKIAGGNKKHDKVKRTLAFENEKIDGKTKEKKSDTSLVKIRITNPQSSKRRIKSPCKALKKPYPSLYPYFVIEF